MKKDILVPVLLVTVPLFLGGISFVATYLWEPQGLELALFHPLEYLLVICGVVAGGYLASTHYFTGRWTALLICMVFMVILSIIIDNIIFDYWKCRHAYSGERIVVDCGFGIQQNMYIFSSIQMIWCVYILTGWVPVSILSYVRSKHKERNKSTEVESQSKSQ